MKPDRKLAREAAVFLILVTLGVAGRIACDSLPNVAPVAALALFAGFYFRSWFTAALVPLVVMGISDCFIGRTEWTTQLAVYAMLIFPVVARGYLRRRLRFDRGWLTTSLHNSAVAVPAALVSAVAFFLVTNFACWLAWYPLSWEGITRCYLLAIPMFRSTLLGDVSFTIAVFGSYTVARCLVASRSPKLAVDRAA